MEVKWQHLKRTCAACFPLFLVKAKVNSFLAFRTQIFNLGVIFTSKKIFKFLT